MSRKVVYQTDVTDAVTRLPVVVIDTTALRGALPDLASEVPALIAELPSTEFAIVYFASRAPKAPPMGWTRHVHAMLSPGLKKRIKKIYIVHARWYARALNRTLAPIVSPKFALKIHYLSSLADLAREMDITAMDINPHVYLDDLDRHVEQGGLIPVPKQSSSIFAGHPLDAQPNNYWRAAFTFLNSVTVTESHLRPVSRVDNDSAALVTILFHAVSREQRLRLYDYGPFAVLAVIKEYLLSLSRPLIRLSDCKLPVRDTDEYVQDIADTLPASHLVHLRDLVTVVRQNDLDFALAARSLGPAVMGIVNPSKEEKAIASRALKNFLELWTDAAAISPSSSLSSASPPPLPQRRITPDKADIEKEIDADPKMDAKIMEALEELSIAHGPMPRNLPSEIIEIKKRVLAPNRKAFGKVAEIVRVYNDDS